LWNGIEGGDEMQDLKERLEELERRINKIKERL